MKKMNVAVGVLAAVVALGLPTRSSATMIPYGLYDTGVDSAGNTQAGGTSDTHYTLVGVGANNPLPSQPAIIAGNGAPIGGSGWINGSQWISVNSSGGNDGNNVYTYAFTTTFNLSGLAGATLSGSYASDNASTLWLNGHQISSIPFGTSPNWSFQNYTSFSDSEYLNLNGQNTLTIVDVNGSFSDLYGQPAGPFGVTTRGLTITGTPVPEPTTMVAGAMLLLPFGMSTLRMLRKIRR